MKILILGGTGMLGHRLLLELSRTHEVYATIRGDYENFPLKAKIKENQIFSSVFVENIEKIKDIVKKIKPDMVLNCVGIVKQSKEVNNYSASISTNSLFPHQVAEICENAGSRLIVFGTDCVFSGSKGMYLESDFADAYDIYGRSKLLGEVTYKQNVLTIRAPFIGRELRDCGVGLVEWFLQQKGTISGYKNAIYSGVTVRYLANILDKYIMENKELNGLYHISSIPMNKYDILLFLKDIFKKNIEIIPDETFKIDRSLNCEKFSLATGFVPPKLDLLLDDLTFDSQIYRSIAN